MFTFAFMNPKEKAEFRTKAIAIRVEKKYAIEFLQIIHKQYKKFLAKKKK